MLGRWDCVSDPDGNSQRFSDLVRWRLIGSIFPDLKVWNIHYARSNRIEIFDDLDYRFLTEIYKRRIAKTCS
jgi:hypothetical protein